MKRLVPFWIVGGLLVVGLLYGVRWYVRDQANRSATVAARVATEKVETERHLAAVLLHSQQLAACGRGNLLRRAIKVNTLGLSQLAHELAVSRRVAANLETAPGLAKHDLKVANGYVKLANGLSYPPQVDCAAKYPDPFADPHHR